MCIINNTRQFIFVHVPKCAGTSVTEYYSSFSTCRDIEVGATQIGEVLQPHYIKRYGLSKHSTLEEIDKALGEKVINKFITFGFSRNPYDRLVSTFTFLRKWSGWSEHLEFQKITDVNEFVRSDYFSGDGIDRILRPQVFWLGIKSDGSSKCVDYVGRIDDMHRSILEINSKIGLDDQSLSVKMVNSSKGDPVNKGVNLNLDEISKKAIFERYFEDFMSFGYSE